MQRNVFRLEESFTRTVQSGPLLPCIAQPFTQTHFFHPICQTSNIVLSMGRFIRFKKEVSILLSKEIRPLETCNEYNWGETATLSRIFFHSSPPPHFFRPLNIVSFIYATNPPFYPLMIKFLPRGVGWFFHPCSPRRTESHFLQFWQSCLRWSSSSPPLTLGNVVILLSHSSSSSQMPILRAAD